MKMMVFEPVFHRRFFRGCYSHYETSLFLCFGDTMINNGLVVPEFSFHEEGKTGRISERRL